LPAPFWRLAAHAVRRRHNRGMAPARILVTVEHSAGTGGVVREGGHAWLSLRVPQQVTRLDDHRPAVIGVDDRTLQGGLLPGGAVTAWATDDRGERHRAAAGNGAWAVVLAQPADGRPRPVCFRDAGGALVAPVLPASWARTPVLDAGEPCPACDSQQGWDEVVADDDSRGTRGFVQQPAPFVVCRARALRRAADGRRGARRRRAVTSTRWASPTPCWRATARSPQRRSSRASSARPMSTSGSRRRWRSRTWTSRSSSLAVGAVGGLS
jgi:hypothetical protein